MKKTYVKPEVYFESFELSANIATGCGRPLGHTQNDCRETLGDFANVPTIFVDGCNPNLEDHGYCYHVPLADNSLFTS